MRLYELKQKEIIHICTCKSLRCPIDVEFDFQTGKLTSLIVPGAGRFSGLFGRENEYIIPLECVFQIGEDIILVKIEEDLLHQKKKLL